jgi:DNA polymerase III subunit epsilon
VDIFKDPVVFVDIETSGGSVNSRITEVAAIRVENGEIAEEFTSLVNPGQALPRWITELTGIKDADLVDAPYFEDIASELHRILDGAIFIAHNVRFDYGFIKRELEAAGFRFNPKLLCTVRLSRALYASSKGHSLEKIIARHGIKVSSRHRAYDDAKAILDFAELAYTEHGVEAFFEAVKKQLKSQAVPANLDSNQVELIENKPGVYVFEDEEGRPVYVGKSIGLKSRVKSHFQNDIRSDKEMRIAQLTQNVRTIETRNELEALLLESKLVKDLMPTLNRRLRRVSSNYVIKKATNEDGYSVLGVHDEKIEDIASTSEIYGIYTSKAKAKHSLEEKRKTFDLCPKLLGLEKTSQACFLYQLGKCRGACVGKERPEIYNLRVELASQRSKMEQWKYHGPMVVGTEDGTRVVIDKWVVLGFIDDQDEFQQVEKRFDLDTYRILVSFIKRNIHTIQLTPYTS